MKVGGVSVEFIQHPKPFVSVMSDLDAKVLRSVEGALYRESETMLTETLRVTPVDTGALRASGQVVGPNRDRDGTTVYIGFGGPSADYAFVVHEDLSAVHRVGHAKYLQETVQNDVDGGISARRIQADLENQLR